MSTIRGVVVCPRYELAGASFALNALLDAVDLRRYLLYWDRIAYAFPHGMGKPNLHASPDLQFVESAGLLTLHDTPVTTADIGKPQQATPPHLAAATGGALFSTTTPTSENPTGILILGYPLSLWHELNYFAPIRAAAALQEDGSSLWSAAYTGSLPPSALRLDPPALVAEAALVSALPIPQEDVPLNRPGNLGGRLV